MIVFAARMDEANRRVLEDDFVVRLVEQGVAARRSYEIFPKELPVAAEAREVVEKHGFEGILVATLKDRRQRQIHVPGYGGGFWGGAYGYGPGWSAPTPGYVQTEEQVTFETTVWDLRGQDRLVWAALTTTSNPSAGPEFVESVTKTVIPQAAAAGLVPSIVRRN
jgi:hypothetical protein